MSRHAAKRTLATRGSQTPRTPSNSSALAPDASHLSADLCSMVRFGDALAGAVAKEYGREVVAACTEDDWGDPCTLIMMSDATDPDTYWWLLVRESEQLNWETRPAREDRRAALRFRLTTLTKNNGRVGTSLRDVDYSKDEVFGYLLVRLWWQARMSEGHTSETARLLLGLSVPTYLLALLAFPADGPPTLRDGTDH